MKPQVASHVAIHLLTIFQLTLCFKRVETKATSLFDWRFSRKERSSECVCCVLLLLLQWSRISRQGEEVIFDLICMLFLTWVPRDSLWATFAFMLYRCCLGCLHVLWCCPSLFSCPACLLNSFRSITERNCTGKSCRAFFSSVKNGAECYANETDEGHCGAALYTVVIYQLREVRYWVNVNSGFKFPWSK